MTLKAERDPIISPHAIDERTYFQPVWHDGFTTMRGPICEMEVEARDHFIQNCGPDTPPHALTIKRIRMTPDQFESLEEFRGY